MKSLLRRILLARYATAWVLTAGLVVSAQAQTVLFDFGDDTSYRGLSITNPDFNGNYWNSLHTGVFYENLIDSSNNPTTIDFGFSTGVGTDSYNGPAGATSAGTLETDVTFSDVDGEALGTLGGGCADQGLTGTCEGVFDYVNSDPGVGPVRFEIQNLDPTKTYDLTFFGSHKYSTDNATVYSVYTDNTYTTLVDSVTLNHQDTTDAALHNRDMVATLTGLAPQESDILYVQFVGDQGHEGYLNVLELEGSASTASADYDGDGDVDGDDFFVWQRGNSTNGLTPGDLGCGKISTVTALVP